MALGHVSASVIVVAIVANASRAAWPGVAVIRRPVNCIFTRATGCLGGYSSDRRVAWHRHIPRRYIARHEWAYIVIVGIFCNCMLHRGMPDAMNSAKNERRQPADDGSRSVRQAGAAWTERTEQVVVHQRNWRLADDDRRTSGRTVLVNRRTVNLKLHLSSIVPYVVILTQCTFCSPRYVVRAVHPRCSSLWCCRRHGIFTIRSVGAHAPVRSPCRSSRPVPVGYNSYIFWFGSMRPAW